MHVLPIEIILFGVVFAGASAANLVEAYCRNAIRDHYFKLCYRADEPVQFWYITARTGLFLIIFCAITGVGVLEMMHAG